MNKLDNETTSDYTENTQILMDVLTGMGFADLEERVNQRLDEVNNYLKLKNILSRNEIKEIQIAMKNYELPSPRGFAHAMSIHGLKCDIQYFDIDRVYDSNSLGNLSSTLHRIGIKNENIFLAIRSAIRTAKKYGK